MTLLDWIVLVSAIGGIAAIGAYKTRHVKDMEGYFRGGNTLAWPTIGLSIMATQASAITFLSTPGQAYEDGMRFVQFYFGLPLAMIVISAVFLPIYYRLQVYTAYEYLEHRFDARVRYLGALLFLIQRGLASGITIYAPSIILSSLLGWPMDLTIVGIGFVVIAYTVSGGTLAVSQTQKQQMMVMMGGMLVALVLVILRLPEDVSVGHAVKLAGAMGKMNVLSFDLDLENRYNFWSGIAGGFFLALSYFGTDQSQVQRYLGGRSLTESRLGLVFNGIFKIPMQFLILFIGVMVFVFYLFVKPPIFWNGPALERVRQTEYAGTLRQLEARFDQAFIAQKDAAERYAQALESGLEIPSARAALQEAGQEATRIREEARTLVGKALPGTEIKDADYVFLSFVLQHLPSGLVGLLIAVIMAAAMSSTASELTALGSTTTVDLYKRIRGKMEPQSGDLRVSKLFTVLWGIVAIAFASFATLVDNLIEAVNIIGSLFYGTMLGLFVLGFFLKRVSSTPTLVGALVAEGLVISLFFGTSLGFLWFNVVGCAATVLIAAGLELVWRTPNTRPEGARP